MAAGVVWVIAMTRVQAGAQAGPDAIGPAENPPASLNLAQAPQASPQQPAAAAGATYVGETTCLTCHDDKKQGYF